jgi:hypothetical protein
VCNATTSKNDSAVSSSFSSDANRRTGANSAHKLAVLREEHRRENPITATILPVRCAEKFLTQTFEKKIYCLIHLKKRTVAPPPPEKNESFKNFRVNTQLLLIQGRIFNALMFSL